jgi:phosphoribosylamine--glycine ligase
MTNQTSPDEFHIFHSGTVLGGQDKTEILTAGGRVLCVTALGENIKLAHHRAYDIASKIHFEGCQMRHDIGHKGMENYDR